MNHNWNFPRNIAGVELPKTPLIGEALDLVKRESSEMLFNHVVRSFIFGKLLAPDEPVDDEVVFLSALLHDLGLTAYARGKRRFEIEGADAARRFLIDRGYPAQLAWLVWDNIALHTWSDINLSKEAEGKVVQRGIVADAAGVEIASLEPERVAEVLQAFPRLSFESGFLDLLRIEAEEKKETHIVHPVHMVAEHCCYHVAIPDLRGVLQSAFAETHGRSV